ncbi:MAG: LuxR family transcriptional regulator [Actinomycetota bacterium]
MIGVHGMDVDGLLGRDGELARLRDVAEGVGAGRGRALLVMGAPGVGKSALVRAARPAGMPLLEVAGVESEIDLAFAGLAALLDPVRGHLEALPDPQRRALRAALDGAPDLADGALVLHAVVALLTAAASTGPLWLEVDDVQWLDPSSRQAVAFVARRAARIGLGLVVVRSVRGEEPADGWPDVEVLAVGELPRDASLALARRGGLPDAVAEELVEAVGGNALALAEAPALLAPAERDGRVALPAPVPVGDRLRRAYAGRLGELPERTREALLLAALSRDGAAATLAAALGGMDAFGPAEDAGLVVVGGRGVRFRHPIVRAVVEGIASADGRRAAHRALAAAADGPERVWHLAAAAQGPDEDLAAGLAELGGDAQRRGAPASAAMAFARAAALSPDPAAAAARTVAAASLEIVAGRPGQARRLLDDVLTSVTDPLVRADIQLLRGTAIQQSGRPMAAFALLEREAERVLPHDAARAAGLLTQAGVALFAHGPVERLAALAERALALVPPQARLVPAVLHASALTSLGEHERARALLRAPEARLDVLDPTGPGHEILTVVALCHLWMEDHEDAERLLGWLVETVRERGGIVPLAFPLAVLATVHLRRGAFAEASALCAEGLALGEDAVGGFLHSLTLVAAAFVAAHVGDGAACVEHAERARALALRLDLTSTLACAEQALGFLALGRGDAPTAVAHLERAMEHTRRFGSRDPSFLYTHGDLIEAYVRVGRTRDAEELTQELADGTARTGGAWAAAAAARCRALLDGDERLDGHVRAALAAHARVTLPFEQARTQLVLGERLRRARRRADARAVLAAAHEAFTALGAGHWAARAAHELEACGARPTVGAATDGPLTPREREVCALVAGGATNREVAATLFMSPRTVEHHLRLAYRKLGVRSRTELTSRWGPELSSR